MYQLVIALTAVVAISAYGAQAAYASGAESGGGSSVGTSSVGDGSGFDSARDVQERAGGAVSTEVRAGGFDSPRDMQERATAGFVSSNQFHANGFDSTRDAAELALLRERGINDNFHFEHRMRSGMRSDDVMALQIELSHAGAFSGSVDGSFGRMTRKSVMEFQRKHGLRADGIVGHRTLNKLNEFRFARLSGANSARDFQEAGVSHQ